MPQYQKAFVLLKIDPGHETKVVDALLKIPEVEEAHIVPGIYDVLAVISSKKNVALPGDEKIYWIVLEKINKIKHIRDSQTLIPQYSKYKSGWRHQPYSFGIFVTSSPRPRLIRTSSSILTPSLPRRYTPGSTVKYIPFASLCLPPVTM